MTKLFTHVQGKHKRERQCTCGHAALVHYTMHFMSGKPKEFCAAEACDCKKYNQRKRRTHKGRSKVEKM